MVQSKTVRPDIANFRHFVEILKEFDNVYFVLGAICGQNMLGIWQSLIVVTVQNWKQNLTTWSHWIQKSCKARSHTTPIHSDLNFTDLVCFNALILYTLNLDSQIHSRLTYKPLAQWFLSHLLLAQPTFARCLSPNWHLPKDQFAYLKGRYMLRFQMKLNLMTP